MLIHKQVSLKTNCLGSNRPAYQKKGEEIKPIGERAVSDTQFSSELRNEIPKLPPCPVCGGEVKTYLCSLPDELDQWCFSYSVPRPSKNKWCSFCDDITTFSTSDDAAKAWRLKVKGNTELKSSKYFAACFALAGFFIMVAVLFDLISDLI